MSSITIGGIISGLDTTGIITKLVAVEGNSQTLLTNQQTAQKAAVSAYSGLLSSIGTLATQVSSLGDTSTWAATTASSSSSSVTAVATGNNASTLTFTVDSVAASHTIISSGTFSSLSDSASAAGSLTLTKHDGTTSTIDVGNGSLAEVVAGINGANVGLTATAVQTSAGKYRLQIGATASGVASQFSLTNTTGNAADFAPMGTLAVGTDAKITVGDASPGSTTPSYTVASATNTFTGVASGLTFTVSQPTTTPVTVSSVVDPSAVATRIGAVVTNMNNLLASLASSTAYDSTTKTGGPLLGDSTVRSLQQTLLSTVSGMNAAGMSVTSSGQITFDAAAFTSAYKASPTTVMNSYGATSKFTAGTGAANASATYVNAVAGTVAGTYAINVSSNAKTEQWQAVPPGTGIVGRTLTISRGTSTISFTATAGDPSETAADALTRNVDELNAKLSEAGFGATATLNASNAIVIKANAAGSAQAFTVAVDSTWAADPTGSITHPTSGADIQGTIGGVLATGVGNLLTVPPNASSNAAGLSVAVTASDAEVTASDGDIGSISYQPGLAQQLSKVFSQMSDSSTGQLVTAQAAATKQVSSLQTQIDSWTTRLADYKANLTYKFTQMETALASLKTQSTALSQYFNTSSSSSSSSSS
jgi:flagellar hook-associated protein 2